MKKLPQNNVLNLDALASICDGHNSRLIVAPYVYKVGKELVLAMFMDFRMRNPEALEKLGEEKLAEVFGMSVEVDMRLKDREWILITPKEIVYSKGDNTNSE